MTPPPVLMVLAETRLPGTKASPIVVGSSTQRPSCAASPPATSAERARPPVEERMRSWIEANAPKHLKPYLEASGFGNTNTGPHNTLAEAKAWQAKKAAAGWACLQWPKAYGGRGATPIQSVIWSQEEGIYSKLSGAFIIGQGMCAPTLMGKY